ncbi:MAG: DUF6261 family protein [Tannerellaceae bacterium]|jgi:hypothetical protein|nr:DUF6261 family protein [Tannerellaceae bacterium]
MNPFRKFAALVRRLRNAEHFGFYEYIVKFLTLHLAEIPEIKPLCDSFFARFQKEDEIFKHSLQAEETGPIRDLFILMRNEFMIIKRVVETAAYTDVQAEKVAAEKLSLVVKTYKKVPSAAMNEASALVINMIQDLRLSKNAASVATLGLSTHVDKMEEHNEAFRELYLARAQEIESLADMGNMREARPLTDESFNLVAYALGGDYVTAVASGNTARAAILKVIIDGINAIVLQYEHIYARRSPGATIDQPDKIEPDTPEDEIPVFAVDAQTVSFVENDGGPVMIVVLGNASRLAELHPDLSDAELLLTNADGLDVAFPIDGYATETVGESEQTTGLRVRGPSGRWFDSPFRGIGPAEAKIMNDEDALLAVLTGVIYPETFVN